MQRVTSWLNRLGLLGELVKFEHTIFALPFAYAGAFLGARGMPTWTELILITLAMVGARTSAMGFNRLIDKQIDAKNPRTKDRPLAKGVVSDFSVLSLSIGGLILLGVSAWLLNPVAALFLPLVIPILVIYPYTKRFTWLCHYWLGLAQFFAPFGGWIAVTGQVELGAIILGLVVGLWIAGFDIIYATQDFEFDRQEKLHSVPANFGLERALNLARLTHVVVIFLLVVFHVGNNMGLAFLIGIIIAALMLIYEHSLVSAEDLSRVNVAFFNVNAMISIVLFVAVVLDLFVL